MPRPILKFDHIGEFSILIFADIQDRTPVRAKTLRFMRSLIEQEQPDLVVLLGDMISGLSPKLLFSKRLVQKTIDEIVAPMEDAGIPFAMVFGNHDADSLVSVSTQLDFYRSYANCLAPGREEMSQWYDYNIIIHDAAMERKTYNLWFFNNGRTRMTRHGIDYLGIQPGQIQWYESRCRALKAGNDDVPIPALAFQHIPILQIYNLLSAAKHDANGSVRGHGPNRGKRYMLNADKTHSGMLLEAPCPAWQENHQFASWLRQQDIKAAFFGHDHLNDFAGCEQGIQLFQTPGAGTASYGGVTRGARLVTLRQNDPTFLFSKMITYPELGL